MRGPEGRSEALTGPQFLTDVLHGLQALVNFWALLKLSCGMPSTCHNLIMLMTLKTQDHLCLVLGHASQQHPGVFTWAQVPLQVQHFQREIPCCILLRRTNHGHIGWMWSWLMQVRQVPMVSDKHRETICLRMWQTLYVWTVACMFNGQSHRCVL